MKRFKKELADALSILIPLAFLALGVVYWFFYGPI